MKNIYKALSKLEQQAIEIALNGNDNRSSILGQVVAIEINTIETNEEVQVLEVQTGLKAHAGKLLVDLSKSP